MFGGKLTTYVSWPSTRWKNWRRNYSALARHGPKARYCLAVVSATTAMITPRLRRRYPFITEGMAPTMPVPAAATRNDLRMKETRPGEHFGHEL